MIEIHTNYVNVSTYYVERDWETMPRIIIQAKAGRTLDQKSLLAKSVTEAVADSFDCSKESVSIVIEEIEPTNLAKAGKLESET